tara:strand:- start:1129 stop:1410 length:282 start_codon:yes stop_codon:yes gene_type:complete
MQYLLGLLAAAIGGLFFYRTKAKSAEAINENVETKSKINEISRETEALAGRADAEQERREAIQRDTQEKTKGVDTNEELVKFIDAYAKNKTKK